MIIKDKSQLHSIEDDGDFLKFNHVQNINPTLAKVNEIKMFSDNGWTHDRSMRQIGEIPELVFAQLIAERPEIAKDANKLKEWLMSSEGQQYRTVRAMDTGRSGHCIVK